MQHPKVFHLLSHSTFGKKCKCSKEFDFDSDSDPDDPLKKGSSKFSSGEKPQDGKIPEWPYVTPSTFANTALVTIKVGKTERATSEFFVHEAILNKLKFFEAALKGDFKEAFTKVIKMPEDDPVMVGCLVEFLYTGDYTNHASAVSGKDESPPCSALQAIYARKLYDVRVLLLGEKYDYKELCEKAIEKLCAARQRFVSAINDPSNANCMFLAYVHRLYELSGPNSAVRIRTTPPKPWFAWPWEKTPQPKKSVIDWDPQQIGTWIGAMQNNPQQKIEMDAIFECCPDLAKDLLTFTSVGLTESAKLKESEGGPILF